MSFVENDTFFIGGIMKKSTKLTVVALLIVTLLLSLFATVACGPKQPNNPNDPNKPEDPNATYYTVTFDSMGGSAVNAQRVKEGEKATKPANPTKGSAPFLGWFTGTDDSAKEYDFNTAVTSSFTLYAKWGGVPGEYYSVQFDANGGQPLVEFGSYEHGTKLSAPTTPTRIGYSFGGWYTDVDCNTQASFPYTVNGDVTFYAKWTNTRQTKVYYRIARRSASTLDIDYSQDILSPTTIERGSKLEQPANPKDIVYTDSSDKRHTLKFSYWSNRSTYQGNHTHAILFPEYKTDREEITIYAVYVEVGATDEYAKLTIHPENGEKDTVMYGIKGKTVGIANLDQANAYPFYTDGVQPLYAGHKISGYYKSKNFTADNVYKVPFALDNDENDVYLRWDEQEKLTVTFDYNYDGKTTTQQFPYNGHITRIPDPIRVGYTFDGWYTPYELADEDNMWQFDYDKAINSFTLRAKWVKTATVLTFDTRGGAARNPIALSAGTQLTKLPFASRQEQQDTRVYDFLGWYEDSDCTKPVAPTADKPFTLDKDTTLYAKWSEVIDVSKLNFNVYTSGYTVNVVNGEQNNIYGVVTIPAYYNGMEVFGIDPQGFKDCKYITEVYLSENLTHVYADAFENCSKLKKVRLSDNTRQIASDAFYNCTELEDVNYPQNGTLYSVHASIFRTNPKMWSKLYIEQVTETCAVCYWGTACLGSGYYTPKANDTASKASKSQVTSVADSYTVREGTMVVASYAFATWSAVKTITLPDSVKYVTEYAFPAEKDLSSSGYGSSLTTLNLSKNLQTGSLPLYFPSTLETINLPSENKDYEMKNGCLIIKSDNKLLASVKSATTIPNGIVTIGEFSFRNKALQTVTIPNSVTTVMEKAFQGCQFTSIKIPDSVGALDETAFKDCKNLVSMELGEKIPLQKATLFSNTNSSKLAEVIVNENNVSMRTINSVLYNKQTAVIIYVAPAYEGEMRIWEKTEVLPSATFKGSYTSFYLPATVTVEEGALGYAKRIDKLILGENMPEVSQAQLFGDVEFAPRWMCEEYAVGAIELEGNNPNMTLVDGILYNKNVTKMLMVPSGVTQLVMPETLVEFDDGVGLYSLESVTVGKAITLECLQKLFYGDPDQGRWGLQAGMIAQSVQVAADNPYLTVFGGVVYTKDLQHLVYIPVGFSGDLVLPKEMTEFTEIALYMTSLLCDTDYNPTEIVINTLRVEEGSQLQVVRSYAFAGPRASFYSMDDDAKSRLPAWYEGTNGDTYESIEFTIKKIDLSNATQLTQIRASAFAMQSSVTEVVLPDTVEYYGINCFSMLENLESITGGNFSNAEIDSFLGFTPSAALCDEQGFFIIDNTLMGLSTGVFGNGSEVVIPDSVTTVQTGAFLYLNLRSVTIPSSVATVRTKAILTAYGTNVISIYVEAATLDGFAENWYQVSDGTQVNVFLDYKNAESTLNYYTDGYGLYYELNAETLTAKLISDATANDSWSGEVALPQTIEFKGKQYTLTEIGKQALYTKNKSGNVTGITIPQTVTVIGEDSFYGMSSLVEIVLPDGLTELPRRAFVGLESLQRVVVPASITFVPYYAFYRCQKLTTIEFKGVITEIDEYAFYWCTVLEQIDLSHVTRIADYAFGYCEALTSLNFANGVVIGKGAFSGCYALTSVDLSNVGEIGTSVFSKCTSLTDVNLGNFTALPDSTFNGCTALKYVNLSNIKTIGASVFGSCSALEEIVFGAELTSIGGSAFYRCSKLKYVYFLGTEEQWKSVTVGTNNDPLKSATVYYFSEQEPAKRADGVPDYDGNYWHWVEDRPEIWVYPDED